MARTPVLNVTTIRRLKAFPWASDRQIERLLGQMTLQHIEKRTIVFNEGVPSDSVYLLISGVVRLSLRSPDEEHVLVSLISPGELFGITSLMPGMYRAFRSAAFSDCWVSSVTPDVFVTTLLDIPFGEFSSMMEGTVGRWFALLYRYTRFQNSNLHQKLALALLELAQKFGVQDTRGTMLILQLTHEDLADLVGASRQKVTEHMKELERQQFLIRDGRKLIVRPAGLREVAGLALQGK